MNNIITCHFMGGLGNQLFESAHALSQGWKHNRPTLFLPSSHTPGQGRGTENYIKNILRKLKFVDSIDNTTTVSEPHFEYVGVHPNKGNTIFHGYYQSTKNWFGYDDRIREMFEPTEEVAKYFHEKYPQLHEKKTLSLHVRRSEYLKLSNIHPTIGLDYINEAMKIVGEYSTIFIFSDDHEFVKQNINFEKCVMVDESDDYMELWLMSLCENHIMSNSTFSWWGTFLNKNKNKTIVTPSIWFGPNGPNSKDIYEPNWKLIDVYYNNGVLNLKS